MPDRILYNLIGVRADGTNHCLIGDLLSFAQAEQLRKSMTASGALLAYATILIQSVPRPNDNQEMDRLDSPPPDAIRKRTVNESQVAAEREL